MSLALQELVAAVAVFVAGLVVKDVAAAAAELLNVVEKMAGASRKLDPVRKISDEFETAGVAVVPGNSELELLLGLQGLQSNIGVGIDNFFHEQGSLLEFQRQRMGLELELQFRG
jgi:hypothetical protein